MDPELVFREIPGKLVQWGRQPQRFRRWIGLNFPVLEPVARRVIRVPSTPLRLGLLAALRLALRLSAGMLPVSYSRVRPKPPPAYCAGPLPGNGHDDLFIVTMPLRRVRLRCGGSVLESMEGSVRIPAKEIGYSELMPIIFRLSKAKQSHDGPLIDISQENAAHGGERL